MRAPARRRPGAAAAGAARPAPGVPTRAPRPGALYASSYELTVDPPYAVNSPTRAPFLRAAPRSTHARTYVQQQSFLTIVTIVPLATLGTS